MILMMMMATKYIYSSIIDHQSFHMKRERKREIIIKKSIDHSSMIVNICSAYTHTDTVGGHISE